MKSELIRFLKERYELMFNIKPKYTDDKPGEAQETLADYSLAKQKLNWEPKTSLEYYSSQ